MKASSVKDVSVRCPASAFSRNRCPTIHRHMRTRYPRIGIGEHVGNFHGLLELKAALSTLFQRGMVVATCESKPIPVGVNIATWCKMRYYGME